MMTVRMPIGPWPNSALISHPISGMLLTAAGMVSAVKLLVTGSDTVASRVFR